MSNDNQVNQAIYSLIVDKAKFIASLEELEIEKENVEEQLAMMEKRIQRVKEQIDGVDKEILRWHTIKEGRDDFVSAYVASIPTMENQTYFIEVVGSSAGGSKASIHRRGRVVMTRAEVLP